MAERGRDRVRDRVRLVGAVVAFVGGTFLAVQGRLNGELGHRFGDGFLAALVSFVVGLALLLLGVPTTAAGRAGLARLRTSLRAGRIRWWQCVGGASGAFFVSTQGLTVTMLGVAVFTVTAVGAQAVSSLLVDRAGLGPAGRVALSGPRVVGAGLAVVAVAVAVSDEVGSPSALWPALLPAVAGTFLGWQQAVNGLVREAARSTRVTTLVNFGTGTVVLLVVCAVDVAVRGLPDRAPTEPWFYAGGALGIVTIGSAVLAVRRLGVLLVGLCQVAGQLVGALALDVVAPAAGEQLSARTVAGVVLTLLAVVVAARPRRRDERMRHVTATILNGRATRDAIFEDLRARVAALGERGVTPGLATVLVGDDPGSHSYVRGKHLACAKVGITSIRRDLPADITQEQLEEVIDELNADPACTAYIVQLPLPKHLDPNPILERIDPRKDGDGLHPVNLGKLVLGDEAPLPATPRGVVELLRRYDVPIAGANVTVVGRGVTVGRPIGLLLTRRSENATVTLCHTGTKDLAAEVRRADIVVAGAGSPGLITADMIKPGAAVVDVGITRTEAGLVGDVHPSVAEVAGFLAPIPGGAGPMTIAMLLTNTVEAAERNLATA